MSKPYKDNLAEEFFGMLKILGINEYEIQFSVYERLDLGTREMNELILGKEAIKKLMKFVQEKGSKTDN